MWKNANQFLVGNENNDVWADLNGSGSLTTRYIRGDVIDQIFSRIDSGTNYWELTDRLGSVRDVINNSAVIKDTIGYNGFGGITSESDSSFRGRYAWTGREIDTEINLQYNRARYYDAATARWISQDLLGFDAGDSNLYRYARNQPEILLDPSGFDPPFFGGQKGTGGKLGQNLAGLTLETKLYAAEHGDGIQFGVAYFGGTPVRFMQVFTESVWTLVRVRGRGVFFDYSL